MVLYNTNVIRSFFMRKRKYAALRTAENTPMVGHTEYLGATGGLVPFSDTPEKKPAVGVSVTQDH